MGYLGYDNPVIYKGEIVDGKMHSENALLFMLNKHQQIHTTVSAKFEAGQITRIFTIKQKTSVSTLLFSCIGVEPNDLRYMQKINQFLSKYGKRLQTKLDEALCRRVREDYLNLYMTYYAGLPDYLKITPIEIYQKHKLVEITTEDPDDKSLSPRPKNFLPFCS